MKYNRMLCWVRPNEKKELKEAVKGQFPLVFTKNYDDFKQQINEGDYLVFSLSRARKLRQLQSLVRSFPNYKFYLYALGEEIMLSCHFEIMEEPNVTKGQYDANCFVENYLGKIEDLWVWNQQQPTEIIFAD
jgi:hypothetical protein